jgi:alkanesulfonate monooxygenase SsuD/methylene tetrahydromethanopterin reductase-like flavin-dependent oxidoreductase (luciferase family)
VEYEVGKLNGSKGDQSLRFGVVVLQDFPWPELVKLWQKLESLGFDSVWIADHFVNYANPTSPWLDGT